MTATKRINAVKLIQQLLAHTYFHLKFCFSHSNIHSVSNVFATNHTLILEGAVFLSTQTQTLHTESVDFKV